MIQCFFGSILHGYVLPNVVPTSAFATTLPPSNEGSLTKANLNKTPAGPGFYWNSMLEFAALLFATLVLPILAYIPATPINSTGNTNSGGLDTSDASTILLQWYSNGCADKSIKTYPKGWSDQSNSSYAQNISYQIAGKGSTGITKVGFFFLLECSFTSWLFQGALVHFSEDGVNNSTSLS